jgi:integrase
MAGMFQFAADHGYLEVNPFEGIKPLKKARAEPDPLTRDEFIRLIDACRHQQTKNLWSLAVYTGMRHGELVSLAWEDIDLKAGTITIRRNYTKLGEFTLPKTEASTDRVVHLIQPAISILKNQAEMTRLGRQHHIDVQLREYGRSVNHECTFVFNPHVVRRSKQVGFIYRVDSVGDSWEAALKRAGIRHRKAYQSRHTYACWSLSAGANPSFIASQMGHASAQMVFNVYGAWMADSSAEQIAMLNQKLADFAPLMPHSHEQYQRIIKISKLTPNARHVNCVEGNTTLYALPKAEIVARWREQTTDDFRFCFKFPATISHQAALRNCGELTDEFFGRMAPLANRIGQYWLQLPATFARATCLRSGSSWMPCPGNLPTAWRFDTRTSLRKAKRKKRSTAACLSVPLTV